MSPWRYTSSVSRGRYTSSMSRDGYTSSLSRDGIRHQCHVTVYVITVTWRYTSSVSRDGIRHQCHVTVYVINVTWRVYVISVTWRYTSSMSRDGIRHQCHVTGIRSVISVALSCGWRRNTRMDQYPVTDDHGRQDPQIHHKVLLGRRQKTLEYRVTRYRTVWSSEIMTIQVKKGSKSKAEYIYWFESPSYFIFPPDGMGNTFFQLSKNYYVRFQREIEYYPGGVFTYISIYGDVPWFSPRPLF